MADEKRLSIDDCLTAVDKLIGSSAIEMKVKSGSRWLRCPESDHRDSFKIQLFENDEEHCFQCYRCNTGGNVPTLFMHLMQKHQMISNGTEAARLMHEALGDKAVVAGQKPYIPPAPPAPKETFSVADIDVRDKTYGKLLELLTLSDTHRSALHKRGLTNEMIDQLGYKSLPRDPKKICSTLLQSGFILEGVPGFYKDKQGRWTMNLFGTGIFVPFRNGFSQIQYLQIRTDSDDPGKRYLAFSSNNRESGTPSYTWAHIHKGADEDWYREVYITEGALKSDVASLLSGKTFIGVQGVGNVGDIPRVLRSLKLKGLEKVHLCYDMDKDVNTNAQKGEQKLRAMLDAIRIPYDIVEWEGAKGIDDWLYLQKNS